MEERSCFGTCDSYDMIFLSKQSSGQCYQIKHKNKVQKLFK